MIESYELKEVTEFPPMTEEEMKEAEEGYQLWEAELNTAIASGDQNLIEEIWEMGK